MSPKTRERVRSAADRVGYVPNESARRLVAGRTNAVALVLPYPSDEAYDPYVNDPFINELLRHLSHALQRLLQIDLIVSYAHRHDDMLNIYQRFVRGHRVDAFFVPRTQVPDPRVDYLLENGVPFVCHGRTEHSDEHAWVDTDARSGFAAATRRLLELGHERIALLNLPTEYFTSTLRASGYTDSMSAAGLPVNVASCDLRMESGYQTALSLLQSPVRPTALLCGTDIVAVGAMRAIRELGLAPGKDVSVVGADNLPLSRLLEPDLASLTYSYEDISAVMVDMLEHQLVERTIIPDHHLFDFQLIERESLGPCVSH